MLLTVVGFITDQLLNHSVLPDGLQVALPALAFVLGLENLLGGGLASLFGDRHDFSIIFGGNCLHCSGSSGCSGRSGGTARTAAGAACWRPRSASGSSEPAAR